MALFWRLDKGAWIMVNILQADMMWFHIVGDYKHFDPLLDLVYRLVLIYGTACARFGGV
jgi:hypothetical protein